MENEFKIIGNASDNAIVAMRYSLGGKFYSKKDLISMGYSKKDMDASEEKAKLQVYVKGLCLQYFNCGWHGVYVIVDANERFVWIKSMRCVKIQKDSDKPFKLTRILKKNLTQEGYSIRPTHDYQSEFSKYVGKIIEL